MIDLRPFLVVVALLASIPGAMAAELRLLATGPAKAAFEKALPAFERASHVNVVATWAGSADVRKRMAAGETFDVIIAGTGDLDAFAKQGKVAGETVVALMKTGVGVAVQAGARKPDIATPDGLKTTLLAAKSVGYSTGPSGDYVATMVERLGIGNELKPRLKQTPAGKTVADMLAARDVEIGFQQASELLHARALTYVGPLPRDLQFVTVYGAGITAAAKDNAAAKSLMRYFTSSSSIRAIRASGMEPAGAKS